MAAAAAFTAPTAMLGGARFPAVVHAPRGSLLLPPPLAQRRTSSSSSLSPLVSSKFADLCRFSSSLLVRASSSEEASTSVQSEDLLADLKEKWDSIENKSTVFLYGGGALVAVWLSSTVVGAINSVPLLPKLMELVGLGYTGWFVYRYLLFKQSRKELGNDIEDLKKKINGTIE